MAFSLDWLPAAAFTYLLIFARIGAMLMTMPAVGERLIPARMRLGFALAFTLMLFPLLTGRLPALPAGILGMVALLAHEIAVGLIFGTIARMIVMATQTAGAIIAFQTGFSTATAADPSQGGVQGAIFGSFLSLLGVALVFATDLHHLVLAAIYDSYMVFPVDAPFMFGDIAQMAIAFFSKAFVIGVQMSAPFIIFGLIFNFGVGLLSKLMPQIQVFFMAMPANIGLGLVLFVVLLGMMMGWYLSQFEDQFVMMRADRMAEQDNDTDKTEDPSQKRLDDALKRGDVVKSQEVTTWFMMLGTAAVLALLGPSTSAGLMASLKSVLANADQVDVWGDGFRAFLWNLAFATMLTAMIPVVILAVSALLGNLVQHRFVWSGESLQPKLSKISPLEGFKRLFSKDALVNFVKGLVKLGVVGAVMVAVVWPERRGLEAMMTAEPLAILAHVQALAIKLVGATLVAVTVIAMADYLYQRHKWWERQKMTLQEAKEEFKQMEGDPKVKGRIRQIRHERAKKRMMAEVPKATVVITNPTHFAVALKYDRSMAAPVCLAKGMDAVALKIRELAKTHDVPIVENPPLARALYASVDVDDTIPVEHFKAVAQVIGYVMRLRERPRWRA